MRVASATFKEGIKRLRLALGETQEGMARRLGMSLRGYTQWERGETNPRGKKLLELSALCPDTETRRALFGIEIGAEGVKPEGTLRPPTKKEATRLQARNMALEAIGILCELGQGGVEAADEALHDFADRLQKRAGDLTRLSQRSK